MKKIFIFLSVILIQIFVLSFLIYKIFIVRENILGVQTSITPIAKEDLTFTPSNELKYFYEPRANTVDNRKRDWLNYTPYITINSDTLNSSREFSVDKPKNIFRIITLGDSFTFGENVSTSDNYPSQLEEILNKTCKTDLKFEIINLGVSGYDFQYTVERYRKRGIKYAPDLIIWGLINDDFIRASEKIGELFQSYEDEVKKIWVKSLSETPDRTFWRQLKAEALERVSGENLLNFDHRQLELFRTYYPDNLILLALLEELKNSPRDMLTKFINKNSNVYFHQSVDLSLDSHRLPDLHPSPAGHKAIAEDLFNYLNSNKLIPCNH